MFLDRDTSVKIFNSNWFAGTEISSKIFFTFDCPFLKSSFTRKSLHWRLFVKPDTALEDVKG